MPPPLIDYREHDRQIWEEEFEDFVPRRIFNAHIHMLNREAMPPIRRSTRGPTPICRHCVSG